MKIALCLHGYYLNAGGAEASLKGSKYIKKNIIEENDVDVFVHSWEQEQEVQEVILNTYSPKSYTFEKQANFEPELAKVDLSYFDEGFERSSTMYKSNSPFQTLSFLYSRQQAVKIKKTFEDSENFSYDCVVIARFDLGQRGKNCPQKYYATDIRFDPTLDMSYLYSCYWDQLNWGFADHWFYSNSSNIDLTGDAFDKVVEYYQPNSSYYKAITDGWPDSNTRNEFSNEMLNPNPSEHLVKWDKWHCIDNHKYYKWYFIDTGLYKKCKFV